MDVRHTIEARQGVLSGDRFVHHVDDIEVTEVFFTGEELDEGLREYLLRGQFTRDSYFRTPDTGSLVVDRHLTEEQVLQFIEYGRRLSHRLYGWEIFSPLLCDVPRPIVRKPVEGFPHLEDE